MNQRFQDKRCCTSFTRVAFVTAILTIFIVGFNATATLCHAQQDDPTIPYDIKGMVRIDPEIMELGIPDGEVRYPGELDRVETHDTDNKRCVAKVHVRVGKNFVVLLPDGQLVGRMKKDVSATERPFVPATHQEIGDAIIEQYSMRGFQVQATDNFVFIYSASPEFAKVTAKVMETMLEGMIKYTEEQGLKVHKPEIPLPVIMFETNAQFQKFHPMPAGVAAYYQITENRVVLKQESALAGARNDLAEQELLSTIAHEGCHQILHNIGVQQRLSRWPMWLGEGIAEYMAPTKPGRRFAWKGAGKINDMRMWELETFLQKQFVKGFDGDTVDQTVRAARLDSTGYASAWTLTHHLAENHTEDFNRYMRYLSRLAPLHGMVPDDMRDPKATVDENMVHFKAFFDKDIENFENEMVTHMSKKKYKSPVEAYPHFVGTVVVDDVDEKKLHCCFFIDKGNLNEWRAEVEATMTDYQKTHNQFKAYQVQNRGAATKLIKEWKKENKTRKR